MPNIEIKASYPDLEKARGICRLLGAIFVGEDHQVDTYFRVPNGRLKLRESSLSGSHLIPYLRPDLEGPKKSDYVRIPVDAPEKTKTLLTKIMGFDLVITKTREIYLLDDVRIHLDEIEGVGTFFELEAAYDDEADRRRHEARIQQLMRAFGVNAEHLHAVSYQQLARTLGL